MDNTCRDNKNKYTLTFAALLVQLGIFEKVLEMHTPRVAYTHNAPMYTMSGKAWILTRRAHA